MTREETELLNRFLTQLREARGVERDADADRLIAQAVSTQPDAAYLLVQRALIQDQALEAARERIAALEAQAAKPAPAAGASFLGGSNAWGRKATAAHNPVMPAAAAAPRMAPAAQAGRAGPGFLGMAAATMAGVVGGAFLYQGIQGLMNQGQAPEQLGGGSDATSSSAAAAPAEDFTPIEQPAESFDTAMDDFGMDDGALG